MIEPQSSRRKRYFSRYTAIAITAALIGTGSYGTAIANAGSTSQSLVQLASSVAKVPPGDLLIGSAASSTPMALDVTLEPRDPSALAAAVAAVSTPGSAQYRNFLAKGQFAEQYGATPAAITAVTQALQAKGLTVGTVSGLGLSLPVSGTAQQVQSALSTTINAYQLPTGEIAYNNATAPSLPSDIASNVQAVIGLDTLEQPQPDAPIQDTTPAVASTSPSASPATTQGPTPTTTCQQNSINGVQHTYGAYDAPQFSQAYSLNSLYNSNHLGAGTTIALVEPDNSGYHVSDINTFATCYGVTPLLTAVDSPGPGSSDPTTGSTDESELDIETAMSIAPDANLNVYIGIGSQSLINIFSQIASTDTANVVSASWFNGCEEYLASGYQASEQSVFEAAAMEGQSILASSGDEGSEGCNENSAFPINTGAGPTGQAIDPSTHIIYVANKAAGTVSVIDDNLSNSDDNSFSPLATVAAQSGPDAVAYDSTDNKIFVADGTASKLTVFSSSACTAANQNGCRSISTSTVSNASGSLDDPTALAVDGSASTLYVANETNNTVAAFDSSNNNYLGEVTLPNGADPTGIAIAPSNGDVFVSDSAHNAVYYFNSATCEEASSLGCAATLVGTITVGTQPVGLVYDSADGGEVFVANNGGTVSVIDAASPTSPPSSININSSPAFHGFNGAFSIALSPTGSNVLVVEQTSNDDVIATISSNSNTVTGVVGLDLDETTLGQIVSDTSQDLVWVTDTPDDDDVVQNLNLNVTDPSSQPYVTAVGGTTLSSLGPSPTESTWNDNLEGSFGAGGGGVSQTFAMPSYQESLGQQIDGSVCDQGVGSYCREVPDVSADADPLTGYIVYEAAYGGWTAFGGTSASAPLWAGILAVVASADNNTAGFGPLNPTLYALAGSSYSTYFNDVSSGSNNDYNATNAGSFGTSTGYDMATGLGTPIASGLATGLANAVDGSGSLTVSPTSVNTSTTGQTLTFTFTPAGEGVTDGALSIVVPSGWSIPSTSAQVGNTSSNCGSVAIATSTINITGITRTHATPCTVNYVDATTPSSATTSPFNAKEQSTSSGSLVALGSSPSVSVMVANSGGGGGGGGGGSTTTTTSTTTTIPPTTTTTSTTPPTTTPPPGPIVTTSSKSNKKAAKPKISITSSSIALAGKPLAVPVTLSCATAACSGTAQLIQSKKTTTTEKVKTGKKTITKTVTKTTVTILASAPYKLAKGKSGTFDLSLTAAGKSIFGSIGTKTFSESIVASVKSGSNSTKSVTIR